ncbi:MAG TPA: hypothetical protein VHY31_03790 [Streptosporangiaceae bacterium]|nr:hypothetical protein [Streptosporangiaceae bacterium]
MPATAVPANNPAALSAAMAPAVIPTPTASSRHPAAIARPGRAARAAIEVIAPRPVSTKITDPPATRLPERSMTAAIDGPRAR